MDTLLWDRMERYPGEWNVDRRGDSSKTVHRGEGKGTEKEREMVEEGEEVSSSSLIVFRAPYSGQVSPNK